VSMPGTTANNEANSVATDAKNEASVTTGTVQRTPSSELAGHLNLLHTARSSNDRRLVSRVLNHLLSFRSRLSASLLLKALELPALKTALEGLDAVYSGLEALRTEELRTTLPAAAAGTEAVSIDEPIVLAAEDVSIERLGYALLLVAVFLLDRKQLALSAMASHRAICLFQSPSLASRSTHDPLLARAIFYLTRAAELTGNSSSLHPLLMTLLRFANLRHLTETEATLHNALLRLHIVCGDYEAAEAFLNTAKFPESASSIGNHQLARYHYYRARVLAIHSRYEQAIEEVDQALRRAPLGRSAFGFRLAAQKVSIIIQMLCGEIPELEVFKATPKALLPYRQLCNAVRLGDLGAFETVVSEWKGQWLADGLGVLVERLHQTVLRAGMRRLATAYRRISFADIRRKLGLPTDKDAQALVVRALEEKLIAGNANVSEGFFESREESESFYRSTAPQEALTLRSKTLEAVHNDAVRAMRFPEKMKKTGSGSAGNGNDESRPTDAELMDEFMDMDEDLF
jgi:26S proteasome regulatory subunit N3